MESSRQCMMNNGSNKENDNKNNMAISPTASSSSLKTAATNFKTKFNSFFNQRGSKYNHSVKDNNTTTAVTTNNNIDSLRHSNSIQTISSSLSHTNATYLKKGDPNIKLYQQYTNSHVGGLPKSMSSYDIQRYQLRTSTDTNKPG